MKKKQENISNLKKFKQELEPKIKSNNKNEEFVRDLLNYKSKQGRTILESEQSKDKTLKDIQDKIKNISQEKNYYERLSFDKVTFIDDLKKYLEKLNFRVINYLSESLTSKKISEGYVLWGAVKLYLVVRPVTMSLVKNIIAETMSIAKVDSKAIGAKKSVLQAIVDLDSSIVDSYKRVNISFSKHRSKIKDFIEKNKNKFSKLEQKTSGTPSAIDSKKFLKMRDRLIKNCKQTNKNLADLNTKNTYYISKKNLGDLKGIVNKLSTAKKPKEFSSLHSQYLELCKNILDDKAKIISKNEQFKKQDYKVFKVLKASLNKTSKIYSIYEGTCNKYKVYDYFQNYIYSLAKSLLGLHQAICIIGIKQKIINKTSSFVQTGAKKSSWKFVAKVLTKTTADLITKLNDKVDKKIQQEMEEIIELYNPILKDLNKKTDKLSKAKKELNKAKEDVAKSKKTKSNKSKDNPYLSFVNEVFLKQEKSIYDREFKNYKESMLKVIKDLREDLQLNDNEKVESNPALSKISSSLQGISKILQDAKDFGDLVELPQSSETESTKKEYSEISKAEQIQDISLELSKYIKDNQQAFNNLSTKDAKKLLEQWNLCAAKTYAISYYFKCKIAERHLSSLYIISDYLNKKAGKVKSKAVNDLNYAYKKIDKARKDIESKLNYMSNIPASIRKQIIDKIDSVENVHLKRTFIAIDTIGKGILDIVAYVTIVMSQILKILLPKISTTLGTFAVGSVARIIEDTIPFLAGTEILGKVGDTVGYYVGSYASSLGLCLFNSVTKPIQSAAESKKYNEDLVAKIDSWKKYFFPEKKDNLKDPYNEINNFRKTTLATAKVIDAEVIKPLQKNNNDPDLQQLASEWQVLLQDLSCEDPIRHENAVTKLKKFKGTIEKFESKSEDLNKKLDSKMQGKTSKEQADNLSSLAKPFPDSEETRLKLIIAVDEFLQASSKFDNFRNDILKRLKSDKANAIKANKNVKNNENKNVNIKDNAQTNKEGSYDPATYDEITKLLSGGMFGPKFKNSLRKLERTLLYTACTVNYVLLPVARVMIPIAFGIGGYFAGSALGAAGDTAAYGATLGLLSVTGGVLGATLASAVGRALVGGYGRIDKFFRQRLETLEKELAIYSEFANEFSNQEISGKKKYNHQEKRNSLFVKQINKKILSRNKKEYKEDKPGPKPSNSNMRLT